MIFSQANDTHYKNLGKHFSARTCVLFYTHMHVGIHSRREGRIYLRKKTREKKYCVIQLVLYTDIMPSCVTTVCNLIQR